MVNETSNLLAGLNACVIIPTYNNEKTLERVLNAVLEQSGEQAVFVVNDGSTDSTPEILARYNDRVRLLQQYPNKGKGMALRLGFKEAFNAGFDYAVTIDSDGQHYPSDMESLLLTLKNNPGTVIMGSRNMEQESVPGKSSFGNKFSNFWFFVETGIRLPDTQTGYRIYPLKNVHKLLLLTRKFELEIEVIVKLAWRNVPFIASPVNVLYDPAERVSHFRPGRDFFRISVLNTCLVLISLFWYYPKKLFSKNTWLAIKNEAVKSQESNSRKALSIAFGVFMGIVPIWGLQLIIGIPLAVLFRMNKVLFIAAANISIPPMIPLILFMSYQTGKIVTGTTANLPLNYHDLTLMTVHQHFLVYALGASVFALVAGIATFIVSLVLLKIFRKEPA